MRGMVKETCYLLGWLTGICMAYYYSDWGPSGWHRILHSSLAQLVAVVIIFAAVLLCFHLLVLLSLVKAIGLGIIDLILGTLLGIVRGGLVLFSLSLFSVIVTE